MNTKNLLEGIAILQRYVDNPDGYNIGAEHDQVYFYATDHPLGKEDFERLIKLNWFQPDVEEDGDEQTWEEYDQEECWSAFV